jgi:hypothetical protein
MEIKIDTEKDSKEDLLEVIEILKKVVGEMQEKQEPEPSLKEYIVEEAKKEEPKPDGFDLDKELNKGKVVDFEKIDDSEVEKFDLEEY